VKYRRGMPRLYQRIARLERSEGHALKNRLIKQLQKIENLFCVFDRKYIPLQSVFEKV